MVTDVHLKRPKSGRLDSNYREDAARAAIQKLRTDLASVERECAKWKATSQVQAFELAELQRRDRKENRKCLDGAHFFGTTAPWRV